MQQRDFVEQYNDGQIFYVKTGKKSFYIWECKKIVVVSQTIEALKKLVSE